LTKTFSMNESVILLASRQSRPPAVPASLMAGSYTPAFQH
jgi:hypothetical protein